MLIKSNKILDEIHNKLKDTILKKIIIIKF